ncbi:hypothetical protein KAI68_04175 [bacterium]|nr:hypothetical protein [bacterium]
MEKEERTLTYQLIIISAIFLICSLSGADFSPAAERNKKIKAIYGFNWKDKYFKGKNVNEIVQELKGKSINALFGDYRNKELINALHKNNMYFFVEVSIFVGERYWGKYPESRPINAKGEKISKIKWYAGLCPNQEELRKEKLAKIKQLITDYEVDGIWLDFIRYPCHWEVPEPKLEQTCFCNECLKIFQKETKIQIPQMLKTTKGKAEWILKEHEKDWTEWKCRNITSLVESVREIIKQNKPEMILAMFTVPWKTGDHNNAIKKIIGQDYFALAEYVDIFSPMVYHKMCNRPKKWIADITEYVFQLTGKDVLPIIQTHDISEQEFGKMLDTVAGSKANGVIIFSSRHLLPEEMLTIFEGKKEKIKRGKVK